MELFDTTQIGLERALAGASRRQSAIATNLANANTPGYRRQDVNFAEALQQAWDGGRKAVAAIDPQATADEDAVMRVDGSSVDVDTEAAAEAKNGLTYQAVSTVLKVRDDILLSAMGVR